MMKEWDWGYPRESAEQMVRVAPGSLDLNELARRLSLNVTEAPVSVREHEARPIRHSKVYLRGQEQAWEPYFVAKLGGKKDGETWVALK